MHILVDGGIVETGGAELAATLESDGYGAFAPATEDSADASASALADLF